jgi:hypothetical protein
LGERKWRSGTAGVVGIALATVVVHLLVGWRYGFDRDELMALEDARYLAWGYVQYPPMTAFLGWVALKLFGTSLGGFRLFAALAQAAALVLTGCMAKEIARSAENRKWKFENEGEESMQRRELAGRAGEILRPQKSKPQDDNRLGKGEEEWRSEPGEWAAVVAALAGGPFCLGAGALMQYISFDYLCWVVVAWGMVKLVNAEVASGEWRVASEGSSTTRRRNSTLKDSDAVNRGTVAAPEEERFIAHNSGDGAEGLASLTSLGMTGVRKTKAWWVVVGAGVGLGMLAKYTMGLLVAGVVVGVLATPLRRYLRSPWLWAGAALSVAIWLPNFLWEWWHGFVTVDFLRFLHERDVREGVTDGFLVGQLEVTMLAAPLALAGLWFCLAGDKRYRVLGWMYVVPLVLLLVLRGREYYLAPAYPMLYAAGAVWIEKQSRKVEEWKSGRVWQWLRRGIWVALVVDVFVAGAVALPVAPVNSRWWKVVAKVDTVFPEEIGWEEFTQSVADVWGRLPESERARAGVLAGNYGEVGALNLYGERFGLPRVMSGVNSSWERGYGERVPQTLVVVGYPRELLEKYFASCEVGGRVWNKYGVANEETIEDPEIFVCRGLKGNWEEFWRAVRKFA